ncbi:MAG TPA: hypothetical protein VHS58_01825 [Acetobacteraceae bacterium]|jgi:hypothetical protein|nr:hypothetical protein [Acetobacteraceae bacterium]
MTLWRKASAGSARAAATAEAASPATLADGTAVTEYSGDTYAENDGGSYRGAHRTAPQSRAVSSEDDRAFIVMLYNEHASLARQQEWLRSTWAMVIVVAIVVLVVVGADYEHKRVAGALLCAVGVLGALTLNKHRERYDLHLRSMRAYRIELGHSVRQDLTRISLESRLQHNRGHRLSRLIGTNLLWALVCLAAVTAGARMIWQSATMGAPVHAAATLSR